MQRSTVTILVLSCVVILLCCLCLVVLTAASFVTGAYFLESGNDGFTSSQEMPSSTPVVIRPDSNPTVVPTGTLGGLESSNGDEMPLSTPVDVQPHSQFALVSTDTLETLENSNVPINDLLDLARRLEGKANIPATVDPPPAPLQVGAQEPFWVTNTDTNANFEIDATLRYVTDHVYFWIENGVSYDEGDLQKLAETFENHIYPTDREFFGSEWTPGVDGDPHLYIVYAENLGYSLAGYFSSADEYSPLAHEYSNAHETFMLNADNVGLGEEFTYGVLAHEFQHMIHWYRDRNETSWLNEGFSELAAFLNGYDVGGFDFLYTNNPDLQLNDWPNDPDNTSPHYGASFLFLTYFLDRFGESATQTLVGYPTNGMSSIDDALADMGVADILTGETIHADDVFLDWVLASYLKDEDVADGRYTYHNYPAAPRAGDTETIRSCPTEVQTRAVHQYGVDYIRINCSGDYTLHFEGSIQVGVLPADPYSGNYAFWSNKGDESDMTLTQTFDFRDYTGPLTFTYWTWYDLEEDYDYVYLEASLDGESWQILTTPSGTAEDPSGNSYGWGYNSLSGLDGTWIQEKVDISQFAGEQVQIRFEYVTDAAVNGEGFLLDDIAIPETDYFTDFERDSGGWEAAGFVRIQNILPQTFRLALITLGRDPQVEYIPLSEDNSVDIPLQTSDDVDDVVLVVTGTTRFTRQTAAYRFEILP